MQVTRRGGEAPGSTTSLLACTQHSEWTLMLHSMLGAAALTATDLASKGCLNLICKRRWRGVRVNDTNVAVKAWRFQAARERAKLPANERWSCKLAEATARRACVLWKLISRAASHHSCAYGLRTLQRILTLRGSYSRHFLRASTDSLQTTITHCLWGAVQYHTASRTNAAKATIGKQGHRAGASTP